jgi:hypothetical protein
MTSPVSQLKRQKYFLGLGGKNKTNQTVKVGRQFKHDGISLTRMCNTYKTNVTTGEKSKTNWTLPKIHTAHTGATGSNEPQSFQIV